MNRENETRDSSRNELRGEGTAYVNRPTEDMGREVDMVEPMDYGIESGETMLEASEDMSVREINIKPLSSGYLVKVGCQSVAVETNETLIKYLTKYLDNPSDFERKWNSKSSRNRLENID